MKFLSLLYFFFLIITGIGCLVSYTMINNNRDVIVTGDSFIPEPARVIPMTYLSDLNTVRNTYYNGIAIAILFGMYIIAISVLYKISYAKYGDINTALKLIVSCILIGFSIWLFYGGTLFFINYNDDRPYLATIDNLCPVLLITNSLCLFTAALALFCLIVEYSGYHKFYPYYYPIINSSASPDHPSPHRLKKRAPNPNARHPYKKK
jgi:hypothetical protein